MSDEPKWGNSKLGINFRAWCCGYCGAEIENNRCFLIKAYPAKKFVEYEIKVICSLRCEKLQNAKYNAET
jgi:hypothetical protein